MRNGRTDPGFKFLCIGSREIYFVTFSFRFSSSCNWPEPVSSPNIHTNSSKCSSGGARLLRLPAHEAFLALDRAVSPDDMLRTYTANMIRRSTAILRS
jgi:hypothetical protein